MSNKKSEFSEEIWKENTVDDLRLSVQKLTEELKLLQSDSVLKISEINKRLNDENTAFYNERAKSSLNDQDESASENGSIGKFPSFNDGRRDRRYRVYQSGTSKTTRISPRRLNFDD